jgi:hypothetical protein
MMDLRMMRVMGFPLGLLYSLKEGRKEGRKKGISSRSSKLGSYQSSRAV